MLRNDGLEISSLTLIIGAKDKGRLPFTKDYDRKIALKKGYKPESEFIQREVGISRWDRQNHLAMS